MCVKATKPDDSVDFWEYFAAATRNGAPSASNSDLVTKRASRPPWVVEAVSSAPLPHNHQSSNVSCAHGSTDYMLVLQAPDQQITCWFLDSEKVRDEDTEQHITCRFFDFTNIERADTRSTDYMLLLGFSKSTMVHPEEPTDQQITCWSFDFMKRAWRHHISRLPASSWILKGSHGAPRGAHGSTDYTLVL